MENSILSFLKQLAKNNNREWFSAHKDLYEKAKQEFITIVCLVHKEISVFDEDIRMINPQECIFRIYRDVRFSSDKSPYKTNMGAYLNKNGKKTHNAGYYFHIEPGNCFFAGGIYMPPSDLLKSLRQEVYYNFDEFKKIISEKTFRKYFNDVSGENLQRIPAGYPKDFSGEKYLKLKDYLVMHSYNPSEFSDKEIIVHAAKVFKAMKPLNDFLNRATAI